MTLLMRPTGRLLDVAPHITRLECLRGEAKVDEGGRSVVLANPMYDVALVIGNVDLQESMGIGPKPCRHGSLDGYLFAVVRRVSMMRKSWNRSRYEAEKRQQTYPKHVFHGSLQIFARTQLVIFAPSFG